MQEDQSESNWEYSSGTSNSAYAGDQFAQANQAQGVPLPQLPVVQWTASEYVSHEKTPMWYVALFGATLFLVLFIYVVTRDFLASLVVFVAGGSMSFYAARKPATKNYLIDEKGIKIDATFYPYETFRSFSVVEEGAIDSIWLKPLKRLAPTIVMYFSPDDEQNIIDVIANFLPHEQKELDAVDRLSKHMRF